MDNNTKFEVAYGIIDEMIAFAGRCDLSSNDLDVKQLIEQKKQILNYNEKVIDDVILEYGKIIGQITGEKNEQDV